MSSGTINNSYPTQTSAEQKNPWVEYFGEPMREYRTTANARQTFDRYDLPEAYKGQNLFLAEKFEGFILSEDDLLWTRKILPIVRTDQVNIRFNSWNFSETLAGRVPHEGISRIIRSSKTETTGSLERRGLAFILEHGFLKTEEGRRQYVMNIQQIVQAVQVTLNFDVVSALLTCKRYDIQWMREHGYFRQQLPEIMKREVSMFGVIQKDPNGFDIAVEGYKKMLARYSVAPDALILPSKLQMYIPMVPEEKILYSNRGKLAVDQFEAGPMKSFRGIQIYEAKSFDLGDGQVPVNLLSSSEQIGQYNIMALDDNMDTREYRSKHRDIMIYNAGIDNFSRVSFLDALKHSLRFEEHGPSPDHKRVAAEYGSEKGFMDPMMYHDEKDPQTPWKVASVFGEMHRSGTTDFLPRDLLQKVIDSVHGTLSDEVIKEFGYGYLLKDELAVVSDAVETNSNALLSVYYKIEKEAKDSSSERGQRAAKFIAAFKKVVKHLTHLFPTSILMGTDNSRGSWTSLLGLNQGTDEQNRLAFIFTCIFLDVNSEKIVEGVQQRGVQQGTIAIGAPVTAADIANTHEMNVSALTHAKVDGKLYTDAAARYETGSEMHKKLVTGVSHLIARHVSDLNDGMFTKTYGMLSKLKGSAGSDARHMERMGFDEMNAKASKASRKSVGPKYRTYPASRGYIGSPMHFGLSHHLHAKKMSSEDTVDPAATTEVFSGGLLSRRTKVARVEAAAAAAATPAEIGADGDQADFSPRADTLDSKNFAKRADMLLSMSDQLQMLIGFAFITTPITMTSLESMYVNNVVIPFDILLARPFMEFEMNHGILTKSGQETGSTFVGHSDFQLGDNVQSKLHYGNYTFYAKALVSNPKNVVLLKNIFINNYHGGFNAEFWTSENGAFMDKHEDIFMDRDRPSIFSMLLPCGAMNHSKILGQDPIDLRTALPYYAHTLKLDSLEEPAYDEDYFSPNEMSNTNSVVYRGMQYTYDPSTRRFSRVTLGTGHLGKNIYPGVLEVYQGNMKYMEKQNYSQMF